MLSSFGHLTFCQLKKTVPVALRITEQEQKLVDADTEAQQRGREVLGVHDEQ